MGTTASTNDLLTGSGVDDLTITSQQKILLGQINGTAAMTISNGNVGIGTTTPVTKLEVTTGDGNSVQLHDNGNVRGRYV